MPDKRKGVGPKIRFEIFRRDLFTCQYCGRTPPTVILHLDHILAVANGGTNDGDNLITSCADCNLGKSDTDLREVPASLQAKMEERRERAEQIEAYNSFLLETRQREESRVEALGCYWYDLSAPPSEKGQYVFGAERAQSIRHFLKHLAPVEIQEAMDIAHGRYPASGSYDKRTFRYFCGVCWRKIKG